MLRIFGRLILAALFVYSGIYTWNRLQKASPPAAEGQGTGQETNDAAAQAKDPQSKPFVAVKGPLANLFFRPPNPPGKRRKRPGSHTSHPLKITLRTRRSEPAAAFCIGLFWSRGMFMWPLRFRRTL